MVSKLWLLPKFIFSPFKLVVVLGATLCLRLGVCSPTSFPPLLGDVDPLLDVSCTSPGKASMEINSGLSCWKIVNLAKPFFRLRLLLLDLAELGLLDGTIGGRSLTAILMVEPVNVP